MEQIKRTNRLLTTDSIFIRQYLMIPVPIDSPVNSKGHNDVRRSHSLDVQPNEYQSTIPNETSTSTGSTLTTSSSMTSSKSSEPIDPDEENRRDMEDFLSKVDSAIALTKKSVEQTRKHSDFLTEFDTNHHNNGNDNGSTYSGTIRKLSYDGAYQNFSSGSSHDEQSNRRHNRSGKHIKSSLHRLEKQQEELFEL